MKVVGRLQSLGPKAALGLASIVLLVEVAVLAALTTKEREVRPPAVPRVLDASLAPQAAGVELTVSAQSADGTIISIETRWGDGHSNVINLGCRRDGTSYGGELERRAIPHAHRVREAEVRVTSSMCIMPGKPKRTSAWQTVRLPDA